MTRDEILNMPAGRELDALVAEKVMGWGVLRNNHYVYIPRLREAPDKRLFDWQWKPSTDIAAAWEVVEKAGILYLRQVVNVEPDSPALWLAKKYIDPEKAGVADTAPLAICRAALLAAMERVE